MAEVRCRLAPAPTGYLHVGNARTGLFNWLFARHSGGSFILRVEDTDRRRSTEEAFGGLLHSLRWLGLDWDEGPGVGGDYGPYRQTERLDRYAEVTERFLQEGRAYHCYCTPEELEERRRKALRSGETPGYDGRCRNLTAAERAAFEREGRRPAVRFAMPGRDVVVDDLIRGAAHFPAGDLKDFVIVRSDGTPTYLLAAAVDDVAMRLTHVIRGEDLLPSTPRQLEIIGALGATPPRYAHLPLITGPNGQPLSKRFGSVAVEHFREEGYLPEALVNYLALLGWSFDAKTTFFSLAELIERFDLGRVSHNPATFDLEKLTWMNGHYIRQAEGERLAGLLSADLAGRGIVADPAVVGRGVPLVRERMHTIQEGAGLLEFLFTDAGPDERARKMLGPERASLLHDAADRLEKAEPWTHQEIERELRDLQASSGLSARNAFQPIRAAVTGTLVSPPLFESIELLGRDRSVVRLRRAAGSA